MATPPSWEDPNKPPGLPQGNNQTPWPEGIDPKWFDEIPVRTRTDFQKQFEGQWHQTPPKETYKKKKRGHKNDKFYAQSKPNAARREHMANKFLPFIVESSTPLHIFKTLLTRSKGMNDVLVASTFRLVLTIDIKILREQSKELPEMPLEKIYEELLIKHPQCRIEDTYIKRLLNVFKWLPSKTDINLWHLELDQFERKDIALFFCGLYLSDYEGETYADIPYKDIIKKSELFEGIYNAVQDYVNFADSGEKVMFLDEADLRGFILYHAMIREHVTSDTAPSYNARFARRVEEAS